MLVAAVRGRVPAGIACGYVFERSRGVQRVADPAAFLAIIPVLNGRVGREAGKIGRGEFVQRLAGYVDVVILRRRRRSRNVVFQPVRCVQIDGQRRLALYVVQDPAGAGDDRGVPTVHAVYEGAVYALEDVAVTRDEGYVRGVEVGVVKSAAEQAVFNALHFDICGGADIFNAGDVFLPIAGVAFGVREEDLLPVETDLDVQIAAAGDALVVVFAVDDDVFRDHVVVRHLLGALLVIVPAVEGVGHGCVVWALLFDARLHLRCVYFGKADARVLVDVDDIGVVGGLSVLIHIAEHVAARELHLVCHGGLVAQGDVAVHMPGVAIVFRGVMRKGIVVGADVVAGAARIAVPYDVVGVLRRRSCRGAVLVYICMVLVFEARICGDGYLFRSVVEGLGNILIRHSHVFDVGLVYRDGLVLRLAVRGSQIGDAAPADEVEIRGISRTVALREAGQQNIVVCGIAFLARLAPPAEGQPGDGQERHRNHEREDQAPGTSVYLFHINTSCLTTLGQLFSDSPELLTAPVLPDAPFHL